MRRAIVVGASSGIGRAVAERLVEKGYRVAITGRRGALLEELKSTNPSQYLVGLFDIDRSDEVKEQLDRLVNELGGLDLLFLSSGTGRRNRELLLEYEMEVVKTNVEGFVAVINWGFNYFDGNSGGKRDEQKGGKIAAISSFAGLRGLSISPAYSASKSFQMIYLEALRQKSRSYKKGITITDIRAGFVDTAMGNGPGSFWRASPTKAARQIVKAIDKKRSILYVTKRWALIAPIMKLIPNSIFNRIKL